MSAIAERLERIAAEISKVARVGADKQEVWVEYEPKENQVLMSVYSTFDNENNLPLNSLVDEDNDIRKVCVDIDRYIKSKYGYILRGWFPQESRINIDKRRKKGTLMLGYGTWFNVYSNPKYPDFDYEDFLGELAKVVSPFKVIRK